MRSPLRPWPTSPADRSPGSWCSRARDSLGTHPHEAGCCTPRPSARRDLKCRDTWAGWLARPGLAVRGKGDVMPQRRGRDCRWLNGWCCAWSARGPRTASRSRACWRKMAAWARSGTWTKTVVHRATRRLEHLGLITVSEKQPSRLGLDRAQMQGTPAGRQAAGRWLRQPTIHPRDIRSELLVKLALLDRAGADPADLLRAQRRQLAPIAATLASQRPPPDMTTL
jgi:DNA-binding PadR family transcriptional regulator